MKAYSKISLKITTITITTWLAIATPMASAVAHLNGTLQAQPQHQAFAIIFFSFAFAVLAVLANKKLRGVSEADFQRVITEEKIDDFVLKQFKKEAHEDQVAPYDIYQVLDLVQSNQALLQIGKTAH